MDYQKVGPMENKREEKLRTSAKQDLYIHFVVAMS